MNGGRLVFLLLQGRESSLRRVYGLHRKVRAELACGYECEELVEWWFGGVERCQEWPCEGCVATKAVCLLLVLWQQLGFCSAESFVLVLPW